MGFFSSSKPKKRFFGEAKRDMGDVKKGYRILVASSESRQPTKDEIRKTLEADDFELGGWFNSTSDAVNPDNWKWS